MSACVSPPRRCTDCGAVDMTILITTVTGDEFCSKCWRSTTSYPTIPLPPSPTLDAWIEQIEKREAGQ